MFLSRKTNPWLFVRIRERESASNVPGRHVFEVLGRARQRLLAALARGTDSCVLFCVAGDLFFVILTLYSSLCFFSS